MSRLSPWLLKPMFSRVCQEYVEGKHNVLTRAWMDQRPTPYHNYNPDSRPSHWSDESEIFRPR